MPATIRPVNRIKHLQPSTNGNGKHVSTNGKAATNGVHKPSPPVQPAPSEPVSDGARQANGQFGTGNKFSRGNPFARKLAAQRQAFAGVVDENKLKALAQSLYDRAVGGDVAAAKLCLEYVLGKPVAVVEPDTLDLKEWKQLNESPTQVEVVRAVIDSITPGLAATLCQYTIADTNGEFVEKIKGIEDEELLEGGDPRAQFLTKSLYALQRKRAGRKRPQEQDGPWTKPY